LFVANTLVQQFLSIIASRRSLPWEFGMGGVDQMLIPEEHLIKMLGLLVNPSITELDCTIFNEHRNLRKVNNFLLEHSLKNCPNILKIKFENNFKYPLFSELPIECFKKSWFNLRSINIRSCRTLFSNEDTLKFIQENFPNMK
jgi:hypothetical protein